MVVNTGNKAAGRILPSGKNTNIFISNGTDTGQRDVCVSVLILYVKKHTNIQLRWFCIIMSHNDALISVKVV